MSETPRDRTEVEKDLCRLGVLGVTETRAAEALAGAHEHLLTLEALSLTLDDPALRARALSGLALARQGRGEKERAIELAQMAKRAGEPRVEVAAILGDADAKKRFERFAQTLAASRRPSARFREVRAWLEALVHAGIEVDLGFLEKLDERLRAVLLLENAKLLARTSAAPRALELTRALLASSSPLVVFAAVEGLDSIGGLGPEEAARSLGRLLGPELPVAAADALACIARRAPLPEATTGDLRADAVLMLARIRRAGEERDLATGRALIPRVIRAVSDLRVKRRGVEAAHLFIRVLPLVASFHPWDAALMESLVEDPLIAWSPGAATDVLISFAGAVSKMAIQDPPLDFGLEAGFVLRRIRHDEKKEKARLLFAGLAAVARAAPLIGDPRPVAEKIAAAARESLLRRGDGEQEYRALLGCGEALARAGEATTAVEGAIDALREVRTAPLPSLLDEALASADELGSAPLRARVLDVAKERLDAAPVALWLTETAARASRWLGEERAVERWRKAEERRLRSRWSALLA